MPWPVCHGAPYGFAGFRIHLSNPIGGSVDGLNRAPSGYASGLSVAPLVSALLFLRAATRLDVAPKKACGARKHITAVVNQL